MTTPSPTPARPGALTALRRAATLRCPECGGHPIFLPLARTRSLHDYLTPLPGCPHCRYPYEREAGYFLPALWIVHQFTVIAVALALGFTLLALVDDLRLVLLFTAIPTLLLALGFIRHAKSLYLAFDHYVDPQAARPSPPV